MNRSFLIAAAIFGALSVILGAFGAHSLKQHAAPDTVEIYETAVRYQFYHVFALLAVGILPAFLTGASLLWAGHFFITGILLFCGSLYLITALRIAGKAVPAPVGILTPVGGLFFIAGWILLLLAVLKLKGQGI